MVEQWPVRPMVLSSILSLFATLAVACIEPQKPNFTPPVWADAAECPDAVAPDVPDDGPTGDGGSQSDAAYPFAPWSFRCGDDVWACYDKCRQPPVGQLYVIGDVYYCNMK